ncbi:MAG: pilus assembly protein [Asticcacaulis sp.]
MNLRAPRLLKRFKKSVAGNVTVIFGISSLALFGLAGGAIDYYAAVNLKSSVQDAMDASVLSAMHHPEAERGAEAQKVFLINLPNSVQDINPLYTPGTNSLTGEANFASETTLLNLFGIKSIPLAVTSTAQGIPVNGKTAGPCVYVIDPTGSQTFRVNSGPDIEAPECEIHVRSTAREAAVFNSGIKLDFKKICVASSTVLDNHRGLKNLELKCDAQPDPYAGELPTVNAGSCQYSNMNINGGSQTLNPGTYCGWTNFNGNPNIKLNPGLYVIKDGGWNVNGGDWAGDGVSFYFADQSKIQFNSDVALNLKAPSSGTYKDILFFEKPGLGISDFILNDARSNEMNGLIWLPSRRVTYNSKSQMSSHHMTLVSWQLTLNQTKWRLDPEASGQVEASAGSTLTNIRLSR